MKKQARILLIDDDQGVLYTAKMILKAQYELVDTENNPVTAYDRLEKNEYDIILLDMNFSRGATSGKEGINWLIKIMDLQPNSQVIMHTAYGDIDLAVKSIREGAIDFLTKPWEKEKLLATVNNAFNLVRAKKEIRELEQQKNALLSDHEKEFGELVWKDKSMFEVLNMVEKVAITEANVLILGENGTGKEMIARKIHQKSFRANKPFIKVDLGAIPETLFESELFGHEKGAFTDAKSLRVGRFEMAAGGTLFFDEIGNLNLSLQAKLLSAIQNRSINRLGSSKPISIDTRLICATNQSLAQSIAAGLFRPDLLYRINTVEIEVPALRNRRKDIPLLIRYFVDRYARKYNKKFNAIQDQVISDLVNNHWPGNVRELRHAAERAVIISETNDLQFSDFIQRKPGMPNDFSSNRSINMGEVEQRAIIEALKRNNDNLTKAAQDLGMGRTTLYRKIKKYKLNV